MRLPRLIDCPIPVGPVLSRLTLPASPHVCIPGPKQSGIGASPLDDLPHEARLLAAEAQGVPRPPTRQVQSARPPGARGEMELDPSVWQANIAMQLQRPPSRQKPPPEALHLWTPEQQINMLAAGALGRNSSGRPIGRPQSAAPTAYRSTRPTSGLRVKAQGASCSLQWRSQGRLP